MSYLRRRLVDRPVYLPLVTLPVTISIIDLSDDYLVYKM